MGEKLFIQAGLIYEVVLPKLNLSDLTDMQHHNMEQILCCLKIHKKRYFQVFFKHDIKRFTLNW